MVLFDQNKHTLTPFKLSGVPPSGPMCFFPMIYSFVGLLQNTDLLKYSTFCGLLVTLGKVTKFQVETTLRIFFYCDQKGSNLTWTVYFSVHGGESWPGRQDRLRSRPGGPPDPGGCHQDLDGPHRLTDRGRVAAQHRSVIQWWLVRYLKLTSHFISRCAGWKHILWAKCPTFTDEKEQNDTSVLLPCDVDVNSFNCSTLVWQSAKITLTNFLYSWAFYLYWAAARLEERLYEHLDWPAPSRPRAQELLGDQMIQAGLEMGTSSPYGECMIVIATLSSTWRRQISFLCSGTSLLRCGEAQKQLGEAQRKFAQSATIHFLSPLRRFGVCEYKNMQVPRGGHLCKAYTCQFWHV